MMEVRAINDINLYEKIPQDQFPIRILVYRDNAYDFPQHWHEHTELHYIFNGGCRVSRRVRRASEQEISSLKLPLECG